MIYPGRSPQWSTAAPATASPARSVRTRYWDITRFGTDALCVDGNDPLDLEARRLADRARLAHGAPTPRTHATDEISK